MLRMLQRSSSAARLLQLADGRTSSDIVEFLSPSGALAATPIPRSARFTVWIFASLFATCTAATGLIEVDRVVTATGRIVTTVPTIVIQPLETSIIRSIDVREGQSVKRGDQLARLDPTFAEADVGALQSQVKMLDAEVKRLEAEIQGQPFASSDVDAAVALQAEIYAKHISEHNLNMEAYRQKVDGLTVTVAHAGEDAKNLEKRLLIANEVESMRKLLAQDQVGSRLNWLTAIDNRLAIERDLAKAIGTSQTAKTDLAAMLAERDSYTATWIGKSAQLLSEDTNKLSDAREALKKALKRQAAVILRADRDATVLTVAKVSEGSVLQSGERLLTMVPTDVPLEIEATIPGHENGFVRVGNRVDIKFDTFPFSQYGMARGVVRAISADSFASPDQHDVSVSIGPANDRQFYRTRISIERVELSHVPRDFHVVPGMPVTADINIGKHSIFASLMSRFLSATTEAMREP